MSAKPRPMSAQQAQQIQRQINALQQQLSSAAAPQPKPKKEKKEKKKISATDIMKFISDPSGTIPVFERLDDAYKAGGVTGVNAEVVKIYNETKRFPDGKSYSSFNGILTQERNDGHKSFYLSTRKFIWNIWECLLRNKYYGYIPRMVICAFAGIENECIEMSESIIYYCDYNTGAFYRRDFESEKISYYDKLQEAMHKCLMAYRTYYQRLIQLNRQRKTSPPPPAFLRVKGSYGDVKEYTVSFMDPDVKNVLTLLMRPYQNPMERRH